MKSKIAITLFVAWLIGSVAVIIGGIILNSSLVAIIGAAMLFGGGFLVALTMVLILFIQAKRELDAEDDHRQAELDSIERINSTNRMANQMESLKRMFKQMIRSWRYSGGKEKVFGCLFVFTFIACCAMFVIFAWCGKPMYGIIAWGVGVGLILITIIVVTIKQKLSMSVRDLKPRKGDKQSKVNKDPTAKVIYVPVKYCLLSSQSGAATRRSSYISSVTYKVVLDIDGTDFTCYSHEFFNEGDIVKAFSWKGGKRVIILEKADKPENP